MPPCGKEGSERDLDGNELPAPIERVPWSFSGAAAALAMVLAR